MQATAETQEAQEDEGLVLLRRIHELEDEVGYWISQAGHGYGRRGNAYKFTPDFLRKQDRVVPVDIPPVAAQMPDD